MSKRFVSLIQKMVAAAGKEEEFRSKEYFELRIPNEPFMDLVITAKENSLGEGRLISAGHYYVQNGDAIADPCVEVMEDGWPVSIEQPIGGFKAITWRAETGNVVYSPGRYRDVNTFLGFWAKNLREQGFVKAAKKLAEPKMKLEASVQ